MSLVEVVVSAVVFASSASCSLQLWSASTQWTHKAQQQREQLIQLDGRLLAVQAELEQLAGQPVAADCGVAASWLAAHVNDLEPKGEGVLLRVQGQAGLVRERWLDPAAYGLCGGPEPSDATAGPPADSGGSEAGGAEASSLEPTSLGSSQEAVQDQEPVASAAETGAESLGGSGDLQP